MKIISNFDATAYVLAEYHKYTGRIFFEYVKTYMNQRHYYLILFNSVPFKKNTKVYKNLVDLGSDLDDLDKNNAVVIDKDLLMRVKFIGPKRAEKILDVWKRRHKCGD